MAQLPHISRHPSTNLTKICHIDQSIPKNCLFFAIFYALAICHFAWPRKTGPTKSPEKELFREFPKGNLTLGGVRFPGRTQVENWHCAGFPQFFLNIKLPFWDIDGATPTHSPKSGCKCPHRWRNSLISPFSS